MSIRDESTSGPAREAEPSDVLEVDAAGSDAAGSDAAGSDAPGGQVRQVLLQLSEKFGVPAIDLAQLTLTLADLDLIPLEIARRHVVLPLLVKDEAIFLAMANPAEKRVIEEIEFISGKKVFPYVAEPDQLLVTINRAYDLHSRGEATLAGERASATERPPLSAIPLPISRPVAALPLPPPLPAPVSATAPAPVSVPPPLPVAPPTPRAAGGPPPVPTALKSRRATIMTGPGAPPMPMPPPTVAPPPLPAEAPPPPADAAPAPPSVPAPVQASPPVPAAPPAPAAPPLAAAPSPSTTPAVPVAPPARPVPARPAPARPAPAPPAVAAAPVPPPALAAPAAQPASRTVLIVDAELDSRKLLRSALEDQGHTVLEADRGQAALEAIQKQAPDLIVMDPALPDLHGFDLCRRLKEDERFARVRLVMTSAEYRGWRFTDDITAVYGVGALIEKPFGIVDALGRIESVLEGRAGGAPDHETLSPEADTALRAGNEAYQRGEVDEAVRSLEKGVAAAPESYRMHYQLALLLGRRGETFRAIRELEASIGLYAGFFPALKNLAVLYEKAGFRRKAVEIWERALPAVPDEATRGQIKERLLSLL